MYCTAIHNAAVGTCVLMGWNRCLSLVRVFRATCTYIMGRPTKKAQTWIQFKYSIGKERASIRRDDATSLSVVRVVKHDSYPYLYLASCLIPPRMQPARGITQPLYIFVVQCKTYFLDMSVVSKTVKYEILHESRIRDQKVESLNLSIGYARCDLELVKSAFVHYFYSHHSMSILPILNFSSFHISSIGFFLLWASHRSSVIYEPTYRHPPSMVRRRATKNLSTERDHSPRTTDLDSGLVTRFRVEI